MWINIYGVTKMGDIDGGNYTEVQEDGSMVAKENATTYRDEIGDAVNLAQSWPGISTNEKEGVVEYTTAANLSDYLFANMQLNHDRKLDADIEPHIHILQNQNAIPNMLLQYRYQNIGAAKTTAWTNLPLDNAIFSYDSWTLHQVLDPSTGITPPAGSNVSDIIQFRLIRDNANTSWEFAGADAYTGDVQVLAFDCHIEVNSLWSRTEYVK